MLRLFPQNARSTALQTTMFALILSTSACTTLPATVDSVSDFEAQTVTVNLIAPDRSVIGAAAINEAPGGVLMGISLNSIPEGWHGMHFHVKADCGDTAFKNSGSHINPSGRQHGLLNPEGPDNADLPNIYAHANGAVRAEVYSDRVSLNGRGGRPALLDADGSAIVVHANPDDQITQPIGGAGGRIACGEIKLDQN